MTVHGREAYLGSTLQQMPYRCCALCRFVMSAMAPFMTGAMALIDVWVTGGIAVVSHYFCIFVGHFGA
jgi:hypothetical protein